MFLVLTSGVLCVLVGIPLQQENGCIDSPEGAAGHQGRTTRVVPAVDLGPVVEEEAHEVDAVGDRRPVKWGATQVSVWCVDVKKFVQRRLGRGG